MNPCKIIAEICCNHNGSLDLCKQMIYEAKQNGAYAVKFQKREIELWRAAKPEIYNKPHPVSENSYGATYYDHRKALEFSFEQHAQIQQYWDEIDIKYGCSVFDITSAKQILTLEPHFIKIPSPCNNNFELTEFVCKNFNCPIHISFGMTLNKEFDKTIKLLKQCKALSRTVLYVCTSGYPITCADVFLLDIVKYKKKYGKNCLAIGYSGHQNSLPVDIASYALGAEYIEKHFTLDKKHKGTDHKLAVLPQELKIISDGVKDIQQAMQFRTCEILEVEKDNRSKLKWTNM